MGGTSIPSSSSKKEEQQVPDLTCNVFDDPYHENETTQYVFEAKHEAAGFMGDLEDILGIISNEDYSPAHWDLKFTDCWDGFSVNEQEGQDKVIDNISSSKFNIIKREKCEFWNMINNDDDDEEEKLSLNLSLNYQQVLDAWSDRGILWADHDDTSLSAAPNHSYMGEVPSMEEEERTNRREASVMRYKEKRQMRLFSNKIRYQVRKLNAEKRPRLKGRFVKKSS